MLFFRVGGWICILVRLCILYLAEKWREVRWGKVGRMKVSQRTNTHNQSFSHHWTSLTFIDRHCDLDMFDHTLEEQRVAAGSAQSHLLYYNETSKCCPRFNLQLKSRCHSPRGSLSVPSGLLNRTFSLPVRHGRLNDMSLLLVNPPANDKQETCQSPHLTVVILMNMTGKKKKLFSLKLCCQRRSSNVQEHSPF